MARNTRTTMTRAIRPRSADERSPGFSLPSYPGDSRGLVTAEGKGERGGGSRSPARLLRRRRGHAKRLRREPLSAFPDLEAGLDRDQVPGPVGRAAVHAVEDERPEIQVGHRRDA